MNEEKDKSVMMRLCRTRQGKQRMGNCMERAALLFLRGGGVVRGGCGVAVD